MAGIQASGIGSGLDVDGIVEKLVAAERAPLQARITRKEADTTVKLSALGTLKGALGTLRDGLSTLRSADSFRARSVTSSDVETVTATVASSAAIGNYRVEVVQLAKAHRLASAAFAGGGTSTVGNGTLTITLGTSSFSVDVISGEDTLAHIRDAINEATDNVGVNATIINEVTGSRLVLTSTHTGAANTIKVTQAGGDGGLAQLTYDPGVLENLAVVDVAQDAIVKVNGFEAHSDSNTVTTVVDGLTLSLIKAAPGAEISLSVVNDQTTVVERIKKLVTDFNALAKTFAGAQSYDPNTRKAGALLGDAFTGSTEAAVRRAVTGTVDDAGAYTSLAAIGIKTDANGNLVVDDTKLTAALTADYESVARLFAGEDGVAQRLYERLDSVLSAAGPLSTRTTTLNDQVRALGRDKERMEMRLTQIEARYRAQFAALDKLMSQMQSTSAYLAQHLTSIAGG
jgi:flagellar hook-associated protein 2